MSHFTFFVVGLVGGESVINGLLVLVLVLVLLDGVLNTPSSLNLCRKSYVDQMIGLLGDTSVAEVEAVEFALYKQFIAGWGYFTSPQVNFPVDLGCQHPLLQDKAISVTLAMLFPEDQYDTVEVNNTEPVQRVDFTQEEFSEYMIDFCESYANISMCLDSLMQGQNLESFMVQLKVHNMTSSGAGLFDDEKSGLSMEISTATSYCARISPDPGLYPIRSGVRNGVEILVDLETFDNGNLDLIGDGLEVLVTGNLDYSLDQLLGFSVGPGTAVKVVVKPELFSSSQEALDNFDYVQRKCVDIETDQGMDSFDGVQGNYSLSNCLVSATVTEIRNK